MTEPNTAPMMAEVERPDEGEEENQEGGGGADGGAEEGGGGGLDWPARRREIRYMTYQNEIGGREAMPEPEGRASPSGLNNNIQSRPGEGSCWVGGHAVGGHAEGGDVTGGDAVEGRRTCSGRGCVRGYSGRGLDAGFSIEGRLFP